MAIIPNSSINAKGVSVRSLALAFETSGSKNCLNRSVGIFVQRVS